MGFFAYALVALAALYVARLLFHRLGVGPAPPPPAEDEAARKLGDAARTAASTVLGGTMVGGGGWDGSMEPIEPFGYSSESENVYHIAEAPKADGLAEPRVEEEPEGAE